MLYDLLKDFSGPVATVIAAGAAGFVAYRLGKSQADSARIQAQVAKRNWRTQNERVVLELFERRIAIFEGIRAVVSETLRTGQPNDEVYFKYVAAIDKVPYYFGPEVEEYIEKVRLLIIDLQLDASTIADDRNPDRNDRIRGRTRRMQELSEFYATAKTLFGPYIKAHQKVGAWMTEPT
ncbi:hypothetical protein [Bradyrhizobium japonicum]|uniref:hypothetical protein n=1 Tax=Bradyrhizobium japonicum TaxID=375 RepID=UPI001B89FCC0|nr:hypothetical protein [Bradyrhizobium japonicum]MBR0974098.1 hypothetical protein [Bradyrhizobium japonicum]